MSLPAYTVAGQGDTAVLLLHGVGGGRSIWLDEASATASAIAQAGYRAVAIDFPGYGDSSGVPTLAAMVASVTAMAAELDAQRLVLLGHSMGGMVAQEVVACAPGLAQGLVLACTTASFGKADGAWQVQFLADRLAPLDAGLGMQGMAQRLVPGMVSPLASAQAATVAMQIMGRVTEATYRVALPAIAGFDRRAALAAIAVPTLMLAAEHDRTAPPDVMRRMAERVASSEFVCLSGAGHIANVEAPQAFNAAVVSFLQRHFAND